MAIGGLRLYVQQGPRVGQAFDLTMPVITIGREAGNDIVLEDPQVSRHHARLTQQGGLYIVEDLGSTNGTFLNGRRVMTPMPINAGDKLGLGDTVVLEVQFGAAPPAAMYGAPQPVAPPPPPVYGPPPPYGAPAQPAYGPPPAAPKSKGPSCWLWGCGCLIVLIIILIGIGLFLWFGPAEIVGPINAPIIEFLKQFGINLV